ncbi:hypothetical protein LEP1GSC016_2386 [Leptospira borgpetersenii serovar Hardjo-bovis str. Sponselee]|uniref:Uncharacterized protein n=2 Tax=Leptospira TaxID=171 RepID=M6CA43_LEPBO|nr:hypothetical protein LEP1GSC016_2386 [Leptospira borgpetersenii serovar Hardjo-bovis str. Sponselee]
MQLDLSDKVNCGVLDHALTQCFSLNSVKRLPKGRRFRSKHTIAFAFVYTELALVKTARELERFCKKAF